MLRAVVSDSSAGNFWNGRARQTAWRINLGWWLDWFAPGAFAVGIFGACGLLLWRRTHEVVPAFGLLLGGVFLILCTLAWVLARPRFEKKSTALVRIETAMRLHTRLSAAAAGIGAWPEPRRPVQAGFAWRWQRPLGLLGAGAALLLAGVFFPMPLRETATIHRIETPAAAAEMQQWLEQLQAQKLVEPEALAALQKEVNSLLQQPAEKWYEHSSLEAVDHLHEETAQSLHDLQNDLAAVENAVKTWQQMQGEIPAAMLKTYQQNLAEALKGLQLGNLPLDAAHLAQLKNLDPAQLKQLSPAQLAALQEMLKNGQTGLPKPGDEPGDGSGMLAGAPGNGMAPGAGGPGGGGPPAPLTMAPGAPATGASPKLEALPGGDLSHAGLGDLQELSKGEHQVDQSLYHGPASGGAAALGAGGDTVWQNSLTPEERAILKNYYQ